MADSQIVAGGSSAAPLAYTVPGAQEIIVKAAFASFDGTAAGGAFLPAMRIVAPGGKVVGEYIADSTIAAGASAEASFFPGARAAGSGSTPTATADYATAQRDVTTALFVDGFTNTYPADYADIGNSSMYDLDGDGKIRINQAGLYEVTTILALSSTTEPLSNEPTINVQWDPAGFPNDRTLTDPGNFFGQTGMGVAGNAGWNVWIITWFDVNTAPISIWAVLTGGGPAHTHYDDAQSTIRIVRLTEASPSGVS